MPPSPLVIKQWHSGRSAGLGTVRADVGGIDVWFRAPLAFPMVESGDPWLAVGLLPAMALGATLDLRDLPPISPKLLAALPTIQDIWTKWNPQIHRVEVLANSGAVAAPNAERMCFFSGGVDATFSALARAESLTRLVFVNGFDFAMTPTAWTSALARVESLGAKLGIPVLGVETNWIELTRHHRISRGMSHGGCLMAVAHLVAPAEMIIAASNSYARLVPWGTQPVLDPLWSTEATAITHHGANTTRAEKVEVIARRPDLLGALWVCHADAERNCGDCAKCRRSRATLALVGMDSLAFPDATGDPIRRYAQVVTAGSEQVYLPEIISLAERMGRFDAVKVLTRAVLRLRLRLLLREVDEVLLGGRLTGFKHRNDVPLDLRSHGLGPLPER